MFSTTVTLLPPFTRLSGNLLPLAKALETALSIGPHFVSDNLVCVAMMDMRVHNADRDWLTLPEHTLRRSTSNHDDTDHAPAYVGGLNPMTAAQLLAHEFEPPDLILAPFLPTKGLAMIHAPRGIGKTHVAIGIACAVAAGTSFLRWNALKSRRVLLIDGEMSGAMLQERVARTIKSMDVEVEDNNFHVLAADMEIDGLPDLADTQTQAYFADVLAPAELVIVDNLSTLCPSLRENEADSWVPVQSWALNLRRQGKSVLFVHHAGKSGKQRGTSRKEDILNSVVALKHPPDYQASQGARFEVHYEKARGFCGADAEPFEAWLQNDQWSVDDITQADDDEVLVALSKQGCSVREIAERTGRSKSTVGRKIKHKVQP